MSYVEFADQLTEQPELRNLIEVLLSFPKEQQPVLIKLTAAYLDMRKQLSLALSELSNIRRELESFADNPGLFELYDSICKRIETTRGLIEKALVNPLLEEMSEWAEGR